VTPWGITFENLGLTLNGLSVDLFDLPVEGLNPIVLRSTTVQREGAARGVLVKAFLGTLGPIEGQASWGSTLVFQVSPESETESSYALSHRVRCPYGSVYGLR
jgi:hypothetical protein